MKTGFLDFIALLLYFEGGLVDNPNDPGGLTNMGITIHTYKHHTGITDEVQARQGLKELTEEEASKIYKLHYWDVVKGDRLPPGVDIFVADTAVNIGPLTAMKMLQGILEVTQDGVYGKHTSDAIKTFDPEDLLEQLYLKRRAYYVEELGNMHFLRGWLNRINDLYDMLRFGEEIE